MTIQESARRLMIPDAARPAPGEQLRRSLDRPPFQSAEDRYRRLFGRPDTNPETTDRE